MTPEELAEIRARWLSAIRGTGTSEDIHIGAALADICALFDHIDQLAEDAAADQS